MNRWGSEGPPPEAYSRITNPERFAYLPEFAGALLDRLEAEYFVERVEDYGLDPEMETVELARPSVKLTPVDADAAPILLSFTAFPSLAARFGRWYSNPFLDCACDACDETAEGEAERLGSMIDDVIVGRFREGIVLPVGGEPWHAEAGDAWRTYEFRSRISGSWLDPDRYKQLLAESDRSLYESKPWPVR